MFFSRHKASEFKGIVFSKCNANLVLINQPCPYDLGILRFLPAAQTGIVLSGLKFDFGYFRGHILIAIF